MPRFAVALCSLVLVLVLSTTLSESKSLVRQKRQLADLKASELSALISLGGRYAPRGCKTVGCGLIDIFKRIVGVFFKPSNLHRCVDSIEPVDFNFRPRSPLFGDLSGIARRVIMATDPCRFYVGCGVENIKTRKRHADSGLMQRLAQRLTNDCNFRVGCGVEDVFARVRRSGADQRIAELQALIALTNHGGMVAHGQFDPLRIGKRSGNNEYLSDLSLEERYQLIKNILQRAAERNA